MVLRELISSLIDWAKEAVNDPHSHPITGQMVSRIRLDTS